MKTILLQSSLFKKCFKGSTEFVTFLSIISCLIFNNLYAQTAPFNNGQNVLTSTTNGAVDVTTADMDGDGDQDIISTSELDGTIAWFPNDGSGAFGAQKNILTSLLYIRGTVVGDMDNDGDMDVIGLKGSTDTIFWFANDGTGNFGAQQTITTIADNIRSIAIADLNGDGFMDVLSANIGDSSIAWYQNNGSGTFGAQQTITTTAIGAFVVASADLDGDGDLDVLSASVTENLLTWYENDGTGSFITENTIVSNVTGPRDITAADLDGDGDLDVLSASNTDHRVAWFENDGTGNFGAQQTITTAADGAYEVIAADIDNDGDLDVLSASANDDKIAFYFNNGMGVFGAQQTITTQADSARSLAASDLDDDGDLDIVSASFFDDRIAWYENAITEITINATTLTINGSGIANEHITLTNSGTTLTITNNRPGFIINGTIVAGNSTTVELLPTMTEIIVDGTAIDNNRLDLDVDYNFLAANITTQNVSYVQQTGNLQTTTGNILLNADNGIHVNGTIQSTTGDITLRGSQIGQFGDISGTVYEGIAVNATGLITSVDGDISLKASSISSATSQHYGVFIDGGNITTTGTGAIEISARSVSGGDSEVNYGGYLNNATLSTVNGDISVLGIGAEATLVNGGLVIEESSITSSGAGNIDIHSFAELTISDEYLIMKNTDVSVVDGNLSITADTDEDNLQLTFGFEHAAILDGCNISSSGTGTINILVLGSTVVEALASDGDGLRIKNFTTITSIYGDITIYSRAKNNYYGNGSAIYATDFSIISTGTGSNAANISITGKDGQLSPSLSMLTLLFWSLNEQIEYSKIKSIDGDIAITALDTLYIGTGNHEPGEHTRTFCWLQRIDLNATGDGDMTISADNASTTTYPQDPIETKVHTARNVTISAAEFLEWPTGWELRGNYKINTVDPDDPLVLDTSLISSIDKLYVSSEYFDVIQMEAPGEFYLGDETSGNLRLRGSYSLGRPSNFMGAKIDVRNITAIDDIVRFTALPGGVIKDVDGFALQLEVGVAEMKGTLAPGDIGALSDFKVKGDVTFSPETTLAIDLFSSDNDVLGLVGTTPSFNAGNATLDLNVVEMPSASTTEIIIVDIEGTEPVVGVFLGLPEGSDLTIGSELYKISYTGGTGNDVTLIRQSTLSDTDVALGKISVYPNPSTSSFTLTNPGNNRLSQIEIYDITGRLIKTVDLKNNSQQTQIDISNLSETTYILKITSDKGSIVKKLIKE